MLRTYHPHHCTLSLKSTYRSSTPLRLTSTLSGLGLRDKVTTSGVLNSPDSIDKDR